MFLPKPDPAAGSARHEASTPNHVPVDEALLARAEAWMNVNIDGPNPRLGPFIGRKGLADFAASELSWQAAALEVARAESGLNAAALEVCERTAAGRLKVLEEKAAEARREWLRAEKAESLLASALDFCEDREDVKDGPGNKPAPNDWMRLAQLLRGEEAPSRMSRAQAEATEASLREGAIARARSLLRRAFPVLHSSSVSWVHELARDVEAFLAPQPAAETGAAWVHKPRVGEVCRYVSEPRGPFLVVTVDEDDDVFYKALDRLGGARVHAHFPEAIRYVRPSTPAERAAANILEPAPSVAKWDRVFAPMSYPPEHRAFVRAWAAWLLKDDDDTAEREARNVAARALLAAKEGA